MSEVTDFRTHVRAWLADHAAAYHQDAAPEPPSLDESREFIARMHAAELVGITWPKAAGGWERSEADYLTFVEETADHELPIDVFRIALGTIAPSILHYGTPEQVSEIGPRLLHGEVWCQLFSEPEVGSDLAGLRSTARKVDGGWVLDGRKVWNTGAHLSAWSVMLARTDVDVPKHEGITMFLVDMSDPGVDARPLRDNTGGVHFNEVAVEDVFVPDDMVLGAVNGGWGVANHMLAHERMSVASGAARAERLTARTSYEAVSRAALDAGLLDHAARADLRGVFVSAHLFDVLRQRLAEEADSGVAVGARGSAAKLLMGRHDVLAAQVATRVLGAEAAFLDPDDPDSAHLLRTILSSPSLAIAGGTEEIQKNIIAERVLGLPREPDPFKGRPFRELKVTGRPAQER
ncbi:MAG: acyl-CoA dehydrogenase family protein [Aeromicrobium sp.]